MRADGVARIRVYEYDRRSGRWLAVFGPRAGCCTPSLCWQCGPSCGGRAEWRGDDLAARTVEGI